MMVEAYNQGLLAFSNDLGIYDNPYEDPNDSNYQFWCKGWRYADRMYWIERDIQDGLNYGGNNEYSL